MNYFADHNQIEYCEFNKENCFYYSNGDYSSIGIFKHKFQRFMNLEDLTPEEIYEFR